MPMEIDLVTRLTAAATLAGEGISWFERAGDPAATTVMMTPVSPGRDYTHDGPDGLDGPRVQFNYVGTDPDALLTLRQQVRDAMEQVDPIAGETVGDTIFWPAEVVGSGALPVEDLADQTRLFGLYDDMMFHHQAA